MAKSAVVCCAKYSNNKNKTQNGRKSLTANYELKPSVSYIVRPMEGVETLDTLSAHMYKQAAARQAKASAAAVEVATAAEAKVLRVERKKLYFCCHNYQQRADSDDQNQQPLTLMHRDTNAENVDKIVSIVIGAKIYKCNYALLRTYSHWFARIEGMDEFHLWSKNVPALGFANAYDWMRDESQFMDMESFVQVIQVAKELEIPQLVQQVWSALTGNYFVEKNAVEFFLLARKYPRLDDVRIYMLSRIRKYFLTFVGSDDFQKLEVTELIQLLNADTVGVNSEIEVFFSALHWLNWDYNDRQRHCADVMKCIRWMNLPSGFLLDLVHCCRRRTSKVFKVNTAIRDFCKCTHNQQMLVDTLIYVRLKQEYLEDPDAIFRSVCEHMHWQTEFRPRDWLYDRTCRYHCATPRFPYQNDVTQLTFKRYIQRRQTCDEKHLSEIQIVDQSLYHKPMPLPKSQLTETEPGTATKTDPESVIETLALESTLQPIKDFIEDTQVQ